jgi:hypothetical protein
MVEATSIEGFISSPLHFSVEDYAMESSLHLKGCQVESSPAIKKDSNEDIVILDRARALYSTDAELAKNIGCSPKTISVWRSRNRLPQYVLQLLRLLIARSVPPGTKVDRESGDTHPPDRKSDYLDRVEKDHREAKGAGRRKEDNVPLIQLMAALRRITAGEDWAKRSAVNQILLAFDQEIRDHWPELQDAEVEALRHLLAMHDMDRQQ